MQLSAWDIGLTLSAIIFLFSVATAIVFTFKRYKKKRNLNPHIMLIIGVFFSSFFWFLPAYHADCSGGWEVERWIKAVLNSLQHAVRLFATDDNYDMIIDILSGAKMVQVADEVIEINVFVHPFMESAYQFLGEILFLIAPALTFTFILSFFKNLLSYLKYKLGFWKDVHVFSELNERTLALGKSIDNKYNKKGEEGKRKYKLIKKAAIVYADVIDKNEEAHLDLVEESKQLGAILFRKDLSSINLFNWWIFGWKKRQLKFYLISYDQEEQIRHAKNIIDNYNDVRNSLFYCSESEESKSFFKSQLKSKKIKINLLRINDIRLLIYHNLKENGLSLFKKANCDNDIKTISATIVGFGKYGIEILKALLWYCQLPGYKIDITIIDEDKTIESQFRAMFPDLKVGEHICLENDMRYHLEFKNETFGTDGFDKAIKSLPDNSFIYICMGADVLNMTSAGVVERIGNRNNKGFDITTIIYNSTLAGLVAENVRVIGELESFYAVNTIIEEGLITEGLKYHLRWKKEDCPVDKATAEYYLNDYYFYSSIARALHASLREKLVDCLNDLQQTKDQYNDLFKDLRTDKTISDAKINDVDFWHYYILSRTCNCEEGTKLSLALKTCLINLPESVTSVSLKDISQIDAEPINKMLKANAIDGIDSFEKLYSILKSAAEIDHIRWNAYMRTEGYVYNGEKNNDNKTHPNLRPVCDLNLSDCVKDI